MSEEFIRAIELNEEELSEVTGGKSHTYIEGDDGKSNVRSGPGLQYKSLGVLHVGEDARFLGKTSTDDRGIPWYKIKWNGGEGWVSSRYTCKVKY